MTANSNTRQQYPLSTKKVLKKTLSACLVWVILICIFLGIAGYIISTFSEKLTGLLGVVSVISLIVFFVIVLITYLYELWYYNVYFYDLTSDYVIIKKGPITPHEITIPYERIQDVYVDQDLLDRIFGLYDVHLSSATVSSGMAAHIDGLEKPAADGIRELLLKTVSTRIGRNRAPIASNQLTQSV